MKMRMHTVWQLALATTLFTVFLTGGVLSPRVATAATYYVATTGSDANPGSPAQPFQTLNKGVNVLRAGDTLYLRGGIYNPGAFGQYGTGIMPSGTSWDNPITIAAYPGETVTLVGDYAGISLASGERYIIFDSINIDKSGYGNQTAIFLCCGVHHIRFQNGDVNGGGSLVQGDASFVEFLNSKFHGATWYAFYYYGHNSVFEGNEIYDNFSYGIHIYNSGHNDVSNNIVRNNSIHNNGFSDPRGYPGCGLLLASGGNNIADNNIVYNNGCGIQVDYTNGATNNQVYGNIIYDNAHCGICTGRGALNTIVENNIIYDNGNAIDDYGVGTILRNNRMTNP